MEYKVKDGELIITGSMAEYGVRPNYNPFSAVFPLEIDPMIRDQRLYEDERIRKFFTKNKRLPKGITSS